MPKRAFFPHKLDQRASFQAFLGASKHQPISGYFYQFLASKGLIPKLELNARTRGLNCDDFDRVLKFLSTPTQDLRNEWKSWEDRYESEQRLLEQQQTYLDPADRQASVVRRGLSKAEEVFATRFEYNDDQLRQIAQNRNLLARLSRKFAKRTNNQRRKQKGQKREKGEKEE